MKIVFFSSVSGNTKRFVDKLEFESYRIPLHRTDEELFMSEPFVLIVPTYGGGGDKGAVPKQVVKFLNHKSNRDLMRGVVSMGNTNFGAAFCKAGDVIHRKTGVEVLANVEIFGTPEDIELIQEKITKLGELIESR